MGVFETAWNGDSTKNFQKACRKFTSRAEETILLFAEAKHDNEFIITIV